jgi:hypothetical protein
MWLDKLHFTLLLCEEFSNVLGGLVVHDIYLGFLVCIEDAYIVHSRDWGDQDGVQFVMVQYKKTHAFI